MTPPGQRRVPVPDGLDGERLDSALARMFGLSRARAAELIGDGSVLVGGRTAAKSDRVPAGEWLDVTLPPPVPHGLPDLTSALLLAFFACMGFEQVAVVAGEARDPQRDLPVGILSAVAIIGALYVLLMFACFATVPDLAHSARPRWSTHVAVLSDRHGSR